MKFGTIIHRCSAVGQRESKISMIMIRPVMFRSRCCACFSRPILLLPLMLMAATLPPRSAAFLSTRVAAARVVVKNMRNNHQPLFSADSSSSLHSSGADATASSSLSSSSAAATTTDAGDPLGLTRELRKLTDAFEAIGDDKLRYKQLLYMANQLPPMDEACKVPENKVPGCLSTVHVHATLDPSSSPPVVQFMGDSDGLLTKGLVALLVRGLSGNTPQAIQSVNPAFIQTAGIAASLTPGRNNGFLNMLAVMKKKALELEQQQQENNKASTTTTTPVPAADASSTSSKAAAAVSAVSGGRPKYDAIIAALQKLNPVELELTDNSHQHAGHAGAGEESHFDLTIVADAFDGLNLVKRHKLVYMMLGDVMPQIHALQIRAQTPTEAGL